MKSFVAVVALLGLPLLAGCTSLQSVSVTQIPGDRSRPVHAEVSNTAFLGFSSPASVFNDQVPSPSTALSPLSISTNGSSLPHDNMQPYLAILFCMCLYGIFPSRN